MRSIARMLGFSAVAALTAACATFPAASEARVSPEQREFWTSLRAHCGRAYEGRLAFSSGAAGDTAMAGKRLVMHMRECSADEIKIPFHVGDDRSRTWVLTRTEAGIRLKHDHRHEDGTPDAITWYGGDTREAGTPRSQSFPADAHTVSLNAMYAPNVWTIELTPNQFAYQLIRTGTDRRIRVEFDLTRPVTPPPPPWGS